ncbi:MAG: signal peptidase I [Phycisphaerae bacterium]
MDPSVPLENKPRRPWLALVLSLICTGWGHIYCGQIVRALVFMVIGVVVPSGAILAGALNRPFIALLAGALLPPIIGIAAGVDSCLLARRLRRQYRPKEYNRWYVYVLVLLLTSLVPVASAMIVRINILEAFRMSGKSMSPDVPNGCRVLANKVAYRAEPLKRGDIIVFVYPNNRSVKYIKRVAALPGEKVSMKDGDLYVSGKKLPRSEAATAPTVAGDGTFAMFWEHNGQAKYRILLSRGEAAPGRTARDIPELTVPNGHCFVLGDNRDMSCDSRHFGPVPLADIIGRVDYIYYPQWRDLRE